MVTASPICSMGNYILSLPLERINRLLDSHERRTDCAAQRHRQ